MTTTLDDLLNDIFDGQHPALAAEFERWLRGSRRFRAFAEHYRRKIQAKLKHARDDDSLSAVRAELEAAALLLGDDCFTLDYEAYAAAKQRGPDFTVTFKAHTRFNIEVRRLRRDEMTTGDDEARQGKVMAVLCDKVGQMPPSIVNLLWLSAEYELSEADLSRAALSLLRLAERKADAFFSRRGFNSATNFLKHYRQLSGVVVPQAGVPVLWLNRLARHQAPAAIMTALQRVATG